MASETKKTNKSKKVKKVKHDATSSLETKPAEDEKSTKKMLAKEEKKRLKSEARKEEMKRRTQNSGLGLKISLSRDNGASAHKNKKITFSNDDDSDDDDDKVASNDEDVVDDEENENDHLTKDTDANSSDDDDGSSDDDDDESVEEVTTSASRIQALNRLENERSGTAATLKKKKKRRKRRETTTDDDSDSDDEDELTPEFLQKLDAERNESAKRRKMTPTTNDEKPKPRGRHTTFLSEGCESSLTARTISAGHNINVVYIGSKNDDDLKTTISAVDDDDVNINESPFSRGPSSSSTSQPLPFTRGGGGGGRSSRDDGRTWKRSRKMTFGTTLTKGAPKIFVRGRLY